MDIKVAITLGEKQIKTEVSLTIEEFLKLVQLYSRDKENAG